MIYPYNKTEMH